MLAGRIDLGSVVEIGNITRHGRPWRKDGVVIEVVPPQKPPLLKTGWAEPDCVTRYVVRISKRHAFVRSAGQMTVIAP